MRYRFDGADSDRRPLLILKNLSACPRGGHARGCDGRDFIDIVAFVKATPNELLIAGPTGPES